jgi:hypothetical protein
VDEVGNERTVKNEGLTEAQLDVLHGYYRGYEDSTEYQED